jgi:hypothetical protein
MEHEVIEESERDLIESIIDFGDTVAREIMVPRTDMVTIGADATVAESSTWRSRRAVAHPRLRREHRRHRRARLRQGRDALRARGWRFEAVPS